MLANESALFGPGVNALWSKNKRSDDNENENDEETYHRQKSKSKKRSSCTSSANLPVEIATKLAAAELAYINGEYQMAIDILSEVCIKAPKLPDTYSTMALIYQECGDNARALQLFALAAAFAGKNVDLWKKVATCAWSLGEWSQALNAVGRIILREPNVLEWFERKILLLIELKFLRRATKEVKLYITKHPERLPFLIQFGDACKKRANIDAALKHYLRFIFSVLGSDKDYVEDILITYQLTSSVAMSHLQILDHLNNVYLSVRQLMELCLDLAPKVGHNIIQIVTTLCTESLAEVKAFLPPDSSDVPEIPMDVAVLFGIYKLRLRTEIDITTGLKIINPILIQTERMDCNNLDQDISISPNNQVEDDAMSITYSVNTLFSNINNMRISYGEETLQEKAESEFDDKLFWISQRIRICEEFCSIGIFTRASKLLNNMSVNLGLLAANSDQLSTTRAVQVAIEISLLWCKIAKLNEALNNSEAANSAYLKALTGSQDMYILCCYSNFLVANPEIDSSFAMHRLQSHFQSFLEEMQQYSQQALRPEATVSTNGLNISGVPTLELTDSNNLTNSNVFDDIAPFGATVQENGSQSTQTGSLKRKGRNMPPMVVKSLNRLKCVDASQGLSHFNLSLPILQDQNYLDTMLSTSNAISQQDTSGRNTLETVEELNDENGDNDQRFDDDNNLEMDDAPDGDISDLDDSEEFMNPATVTANVFAAYSQNDTKHHTFSVTQLQWELSSINLWANLQLKITKSLTADLNDSENTTEHDSILLYCSIIVPILDVWTLPIKGIAEYNKSKQLLGKKTTRKYVSLAELVDTFTSDLYDDKPWLSEKLNCFGRLVFSLCRFTSATEAFSKTKLLDMAETASKLLNMLTLTNEAKELFHFCTLMSLNRHDQAVCPKKRFRNRRVVVSTKGSDGNSAIQQMQQPEGNGEAEIEDEDETKNENETSHNQLNVESVEAVVVPTIVRKRRRVRKFLVLNDFREKVSIEFNDAFISVAYRYSKVAQAAAVQLMSNPDDIVHANILFKSVFLESISCPHRAAVTHKFLENLFPVGKLLALKHNSVVSNLLAGHEAALYRKHSDALHRYFDAFCAEPLQPLVSLCLGSYLIMLANNAIVKARHDKVMKGLLFLHHYIQLRKEQSIRCSKIDHINSETHDRDVLGHDTVESISELSLLQETHYNLGRAFQELKLNHLAVEQYIKALEIAEKNDEFRTSSSLNVTREAAHNLVLIYKHSGAVDLALEVMLKHLTFDD